MKIDFVKITLGLAAGALLAASGASQAQPRWGAESSSAPATSTSQKDQRSGRPGRI